MRRGRGVVLGLSLAGLVAAGVVTAGAPAAAAAPFMLPYPAGRAYTITQTPGSGFTHNDDYNRHAVDFAMPTGTPIVASAAGSIYFEGWTNGGGILALVDHGGNRCSQYAHLNATIVDAGDRVARGQVIGYSGATGNATGPHLHWNIVYCDSQLSREIPNSVETGTSYPTGYAPVSRNSPPSTTPADLERVSDWSGDGKSDVLGVDAGGNLWYYPHNGPALSAPVQLGRGWAAFTHVMAADWSGDGFADVLGVDGSGRLQYYPHTGTKLGNPVQLGAGWGSFRHVMAADWSGDGHADVLGVDATGNLWYYPHNGPALSAPVQLGRGWAGFTHVMSADWSGDGKADVLGVDGSGRLLYYPHTGSALGNPVQVGAGWGSFRHVMASDWSGDGHADVLGVDAEGKLWYYAHNGPALSAPVQLGKGWATFRHVM